MAGEDENSNVDMSTAVEWQASAAGPNLDVLVVMLRFELRYRKVAQGPSWPT